MTKRIFAAVIAIAMVCTMFAFVTSAAETTTVDLDASVTAHGWNQILNAINFNDYDSDEDGWKQVAEAQNLRAILLYGLSLDGWTAGTDEPWNSVLYLKCKVVDLIDAGITWNGDRPADDVLVCDYMQNTFGAVAYALRGGKQKAIDLWNQYCPDQPAALDGDNAFTYTNNTKYTDESFANALACLKAYMTYAQDNQVCNLGTAGRWTAQKARYASLENALKALEVKELPKTTVELDSSVTAYGWDQLLNAVNFNDYDADEDGWKQTAEATNVRSMLLYCYLTLGWQPGAAEYNSILYTYQVNKLIDAGMSWIGDRPSDDVRFCDYFQNTFGAAAKRQVGNGKT